jgi:hypothetical protein
MTFERRECDLQAENELEDLTLDSSWSASGSSLRLRHGSVMFERWACVGKLNFGNSLRFKRETKTRIANCLAEIEFGKLALFHLVDLRRKFKVRDD